MNARPYPLLAMLALLLHALATPVFAQTYAEEDADWGIAPQTSIRRPPYSAPTPLTIPGGRTVSTAELRAMLDGEGKPFLVDVAGGDGHLSLAGAHWLPGAGRGIHFLDPLQAAVADWLKEITGEDKTRPLVFFCVDATCWLSYNTALRAIALGYTRVLWYRGGVAAWRDAGLPLSQVSRTPR